MYSAHCTFVAYLWLSNTTKNKLHIKMMSPWDLRHIYWYGRGEDGQKETEAPVEEGQGSGKKEYKKWQLQTPLSTILNPWPGHTPTQYNNDMALCYLRTASFRLCFSLKILCFTGSWRGIKLILDSYVKLKFSMAQQYGTSKQRILHNNHPFPK